MKNLTISALAFILLLAGIKIEMLDHDLKSLRHYVIGINVDGTLHENKTVSWQKAERYNDCEIHACLAGWCGSCKGDAQ